MGARHARCVIVRKHRERGAWLADCQPVARCAFDGVGKMGSAPLTMPIAIQRGIGHAPNRDSYRHRRQKTCKWKMAHQSGRRWELESCFETVGWRSSTLAFGGACWTKSKTALEWLILLWLLKTFFSLF